MKKDPLLKYSIEEIQKLSEEQFEKILNEHNEYVLSKKELLTENNQELQRFNSLGEALEYFDAITMEEAINNLSTLFGGNDNMD